MEEYEFSADVTVQVKKIVNAENEDEAMGILLAEYAKKGITKEQIENLKFTRKPKSGTA